MMRIAQIASHFRNAIPVLLLLAGATRVSAAPILLYQAGTDVGTFGMLPNETRETHFKANNNVTITELGAVLNPGGTTQIGWQIFSSDASGVPGPSLISAVAIINDLGLTTYDTPISLALNAGSYYILQIENLGGSNLLMQRFDEVDQGLPFTTSDGNLEVLDGGALGGFSNTILPAFSVNAQAQNVSAIPEPASITVLGMALAGLGGVTWLRRRKAGKFDVGPLS